MWCVLQVPVWVYISFYAYQRQHSNNGPSPQSLSMMTDLSVPPSSRSGVVRPLSWSMWRQRTPRLRSIGTSVQVVSSPSLHNRDGEAHLHGDFSANTEMEAQAQHNSSNWSVMSLSPGFVRRYKTTGVKGTAHSLSPSNLVDVVAKKTRKYETFTNSYGVYRGGSLIVLPSSN